MVFQLANFSNVHIKKRFSYIPHKYNKQKWIFMMKKKVLYLDEVLNEEKKSVWSHIMRKLSIYGNMLKFDQEYPKYCMKYKPFTNLH